MHQKRIALKICFVSLSSYPLLAEKGMEFVGGAENQLVFLARELVKQDFEVSFITYGNGQEPVEYIDCLRVIKVYKREDVPDLNLITKAWHVWNALRKADADIYLERSGSPGIVSLFCRLRKKKIIFSIASDREVMKERIALNNKPHIALAHRLDIKLADVVVTQSEFQRRKLKENFARESITIKSLSPKLYKQVPQKDDPPVILWVATMRRIKQPELFLELAKAIPEARLQMIGGPALGEERYFTSIQETAGGIPNLDFLGFIPRDRIDHYFAKASLLVNTSIIEGFSNTFLEAWAAYTPIVSLNADPDGIICHHKLGFHSKNFDQLVQNVKTLLNDRKLREKMGRNGRNYVEQEHDIKKIVVQYTALFKQLANKV